MRNVQCHECGKRYNFDKDDFCPRCGAFTQPPPKTRIGMDGQVVRVDGINERNHQGSFVHAELHDENRRRKGTALEQNILSKNLKKAQFKSPLVKGQNGGNNFFHGGFFLSLVDLYEYYCLTLNTASGHALHNILTKEDEDQEQRQ